MIDFAKTRVIKIKIRLVIIPFTTAFAFRPQSRSCRALPQQKNNFTARRLRFDHRCNQVLQSQPQP